MRRVLIIASDYPPKLSIASRRPFGLSKYLQEYGWKPVVLTISEKGRREKDHPGVEIIESSLLSKPHLINVILDMIHKRKGTNEGIDLGDRIKAPLYQQSSDKPWIIRVRKVLFYPDRFLISWYRKAVKGYLKAAIISPVDAIISTAKPFTAHMIARHIKYRFHAPWVADFRDLWPHWKFYQNDMDYYHPKWFLDRLLVRWVLSTADALVTISDPFQLILKKRFRGKKVYNIPNGFDPDEYIYDYKADESTFFITYTGHVRTDCQDPEILFKAVSQLIEERSIDKSLIKIRFYGEITNKIANDIDYYTMRDIVVADGIRRPRKEIIEKQMESSLLILFSALDPENIGTATGKIYEYLAAKRPILAIGKPFGSDAVEDILKGTQAGIYARSFEEVKKTILLFYDQFTQKGGIEYNGIPSEIDNYSYKEMASKYARILNKVSNR